MGPRRCTQGRFTIGPKVEKGQQLLNQRSRKEDSEGWKEYLAVLHWTWITGRVEEGNDSGRTHWHSEREADKLSYVSRMTQPRRSKMKTESGRPRQVHLCPTSHEYCFKRNPDDHLTAHHLFLHRLKVLRENPQERTDRMKPIRRRE